METSFFTCLTACTCANKAGQQLHLYSANSAALILNYGKLPAQRCLPLGKPTFRQFRVPKTDQFAGNSPRADHAAKRGPEFVALKENCGLELEMSKCEVLSWTGELPAEAGAEMANAGLEVEGRWEPGFIVYGVPVGFRQVRGEDAG